jgi:hypothetical protein
MPRESERHLRWVEPVQIDGWAKRGLVMWPDASITYRVRVGPRTLFRAFIALLPEAWGRNRGGVLFSVEVRDAAGRPLGAHSRLVDPARSRRHRRWREVRINLLRQVEQEVDVTLSTCLPPGAKPDHALAVWGDPAVFRRESSRLRAALGVLRRIVRTGGRGALGRELKRCFRSAERLPFERPEPVGSARGGE